MTTMSMMADRSCRRSSPSTASARHIDGLPIAVAVLELAASLRFPPVKITVVELVKTAIALVRGAL